MEMSEVKKIVEERGMIYKGEFLQGLSEDEFGKGMRKVNLQPLEELNKANGEGVWAWVPEEHREDYDKDNYGKIIKVILANSPLEYMGILFWGSEIEVRCNGNNRPTLSKQWVTEKIINAEWFQS